MSGENENQTSDCLDERNKRKGKREQRKINEITTSPRHDRRRIVHRHERPRRRTPPPNTPHNRPPLLLPPAHRLQQLHDLLLPHLPHIINTHVPHLHLVVQEEVEQLHEAVEPVVRGPRREGRVWYGRVARLAFY